MAAVNYPECLRRLLVHEGGYSNDRADPGGPTNYGITIADYRMYVMPKATAADVKAMKLDDAKKIYKAKYWDAMSCDDLPSGVDYAVFDYGVNSGVGRAEKVLARFKDLPPAKCVAAICDERLAFLKRLKTWRTFGAGWGRRVAEVRTYAMALANRAEKPILKTVPPPDIPAKPAEPDDTEPHAAPKGDAKTGVTEGAKVAGGVGILGLLSQVWDSLKDAPDTILQAIVAAASKPSFWLFATGIGAAGYIWWRRSNMKKASQ